MKQLPVSVAYKLKVLSSENRTDISLNEDDLNEIRRALRTNTDIVREFNDTFVVPVEDCPIHVNTKESLVRRLNLLFEELCEFAEASGEDVHEQFIAKMKNYKPGLVSKGPNKLSQLDALCDLEYVLHGTVLELGFTDIFQPAFEEVHRSNMTKSVTPEEVQQNVEYYSSRGVNIEIMDSPNGKAIIKRCSDGKVIKNINYQEAKLVGFLEARDFIVKVGDSRVGLEGYLKVEADCYLNASLLAVHKLRELFGASTADSLTWKIEVVTDPFEEIYLYVNGKELKPPAK